MFPFEGEGTTLRGVAGNQTCFFSWDKLPLLLSCCGLWCCSSLHFILPQKHTWLVATHKLNTFGFLLSRWFETQRLLTWTLACLCIGHVSRVRSFLNTRSDQDESGCAGACCFCQSDWRYVCHWLFSVMADSTYTTPQMILRLDC